MGSKKYDDIIKQKLSSLENKHRAPDWDKFNHMLDEVNEKDLEFDKKISQKLSKLSERIYVRPEWNTLYHIISERAARRNKVLRTKSLEAVVLLLLLFTGYNLVSIFEKDRSNQLDTPLQYASIEKNDEKELTSSSLTVEESAELAFVPIGERTTTISESSASSFRKSDRVHSIPQAEKVQFVEANTRVKSNVSTSLLEQPLQAIAWQTDGMIGRDFTSQFNDNNNEPPIEENNVSLAFQDNSLSLDAIQLLDGPKLNAMNMNAKIEDFALPTMVSNEGKNKLWNRFQIGAFLSNKFNYITILQSRNLFFDRKQEFVNTTVNGGASLEYQFKDFALSVGMEYTKIKYKLNLSALEGTFLTNYQKTTLNSINYDFISIPVDLKYYAYQDSRWKVSFLTGLGIDVLGTSEYVLEVSSPSQSAELVAPNLINSESKLAGLNYQTGVLDSDQRANEFNSSNKLKDNLYTKIRIGLSVQKQMNRTIGIYTDLIYQHQIDKEKGVGPNFDLIDSYAINLGIKYRLG